MNFRMDTYRQNQTCPNNVNFYYRVQYSLIFFKANLSIKGTLMQI